MLHADLLQSRLRPRSAARRRGRRAAITGELYLASKVRQALTKVYRAAAPLQSGRRRLEHVASLDLGRGLARGSGLATSGDISPDGSLVLIRTYTSALLWVRRQGATLADTLREKPCEVPVAIEPQGEAIGFAGDGRGYYTLSEGLS